jgi:hypothetical protein
LSPTVTPGGALCWALSGDALSHTATPIAATLKHSLDLILMCALLVFSFRLEVTAPFGPAIGLEG